MLLAPARPSSTDRSTRPSNGTTSTHEASRSATVLVVDDEQLNRAILCRLLQRHGIQSIEAASGSEALHKLNSEEVDLVLLDLVMPEMDGFDVLNQIRRRSSESDLPVIMVTAAIESEVIIRAFDCGANDYVTKPIDIGVTMARIRTQIKLRESQASLRESEDRYSLVARGTNDGIWDWDLKSNQIYYSPRWISMLGLGAAHVTSAPDEWLSRIHPENRPRVEIELQKHLSGASPQFETEMRMRHSDGTYRWMLCRGLAVHDSTGRAERMAGSLTDITEGKVADALTGLPNRALFSERIRRCTERKKRHEADNFALIYLDLDNFKLINDSFGHDCGDQLLVSVARRLESCVRSSESFVSRLGGDEFAILLERLESENDAIQVMNRILESLASPFSLSGRREVFVTVSMGVSTSCQEKADNWDVLQQADTAMYQAKAQGKSCFRVFDPAMKEQVTKRVELENELRHAIERHQLSLNYQPIVDMQNGDLVGFEALARWKHPTMGVVSPADFIPVAEDTGLIVPIGRWILQEACQQMASWKAVCPRFKDLTISVNLSSRQHTKIGFVDEVSSILKTTGLTPSDLKLEVTESALMENPETSAKLLSSLRERGIKVAIDDFGTGYSSFAYLHQLPLDALKIDRSFIDQMMLSETNRAIIGTIITLGARLNLDVIAEGIETAEQQAMLKSMGCELAQGYLFSRPLPPDQVLITDWQPRQTTLTPFELAASSMVDSGNAWKILRAHA